MRGAEKGRAAYERREECETGRETRERCGGGEGNELGGVRDETGQLNGTKLENQVEISGEGSAVSSAKKGSECEEGHERTEGL